MINMFWKATVHIPKQPNMHASNRLKIAPHGISKFLGAKKVPDGYRV